MSAYFTIFLGAGLGGVFRHGINVLAMKSLGTGFPFGTLAVNVLGSFVMGAAIEWFALKDDPGQSWRLFLTTGVLGGFTTFSAFSLDAALLFERGPQTIAVGYVGLSVLGSITSLFLGLLLIRNLV
jgi:CrcB protein